MCHGIAGGGEDNLSMVKYMLDDGYQVFTFDYRVCMKVKELHLWASIRL